jgi:hypothetical protein
MLLCASPSTSGAVMIAPLLSTFAALCALLIFQGLLRRDRIYQFPFLAGAVFAAFILPQFIGLSHDRFLPAGALEATLVMAILSAAMCWLGAVAASRPMRSFNWDYDERRLLVASVALSAIGGYFYYSISRLPPEMLNNLQWTGLPVAYLFFARVLTYGFALAVLLYARTGSKLALLVAIYGAFFCLDRIVFGGRRQDLVEFSTIILLAFWFQRGWCLPRSIMLVGIFLGALFINSIGDYRTATRDSEGPRWDAVADIDFLGNLARISEQGGAEVRNAVYNIAAVSRTMEFDLGLSHWNAIVFSYVPAQIVGADTKQSLTFPLSQPAVEEYLYVPVPGSTWTGLSDAFLSFWYFGSLKLLLIAYIMQTLWLAARGGNMTAQLLYMLMPVFALEAITHSTQYFLVPWIHLAIFLLPALMLARRSVKRQQAGRVSGPPATTVAPVKPA